MVQPLEVRQLVNNQGGPRVEVDAIKQIPGKQQPCTTANRPQGRRACPTNEPNLWSISQTDQAGQFSSLTLDSRRCQLGSPQGKPETKDADRLHRKPAHRSQSPPADRQDEKHIRS